jgi:hypothetical protein
LLFAAGPDDQLLESVVAPEQRQQQRDMSTAPNNTSGDTARAGEEKENNSNLLQGNNDKSTSTKLAAGIDVGHQNSVISVATTDVGCHGDYGDDDVSIHVLPHDCCSNKNDPSLSCLNT